jgi:hypothetical protein
VTSKAKLIERLSWQAGDVIVIARPAILAPAELAGLKDEDYATPEQLRWR